MRLEVVPIVHAEVVVTQLLQQPGQCSSGCRQAKVGALCKTAHHSSMDRRAVACMPCITGRQLQFPHLVPGPGSPARMPAIP